MTDKQKLQMLVDALRMSSRYVAVEGSDDELEQVEAALLAGQQLLDREGEKQEPVGFVNERDEPYLFSGPNDKRRKDAAVCVGSGWSYLYAAPAPKETV